MRITNLHAQSTTGITFTYIEMQVYIRINSNKQVITKEHLCTLSQHLGSSEA